MPDAPFPRPLAEAIREAVKLSESLKFPRAPNDFTVEGAYTIGADGNISCDERPVSFPYISPVDALRTDLRKRGKDVRFVTPADDSRDALAISMARKVRGETYRVTIDNDCTFCVFRFAMLKELLHIHFGIFGPSPSLEAVSETLRDAIQSRMSVNPDLSGEAFCYAVAIEIMIPYGPFRDAVLDHKKRNETDHTIARMTRVPLPVIKFFFDDKYAELSGLLHRSIF